MKFYQILNELDKSKENIVLNLLTEGSVNRKLLLSEGKIVYTNDESYNWNSIISSIPENKKSQVIQIDGNRIYVDFLRQSYNIVVCGAGHISISIIKMCNLLELPVTVIDDRVSFVNNALRAGADRAICEPFEQALSNINGDKGTFFIIVTRGHRYDQICLQNIIEKENAYIGMIGSRVRVRKVLDYLQEKGISREKLDRVYTPIGLNIGAETPAEIAVAIMAEIIEIKNKEIGTSTISSELLDGILGDKYESLPKALVTIVSRKGSAPREVGTKMVVLKDGTMIGTIGGGCVEADIRRTALSCIENKTSKIVRVDMTGNEAEEDGMVCGGILELFVEPIFI
ncbi:MAG: XdhC/CoxI family protein [Tissierellaceae bacterium]